MAPRALSSKDDQAAYLERWAAETTVAVPRAAIETAVRMLGAADADRFLAGAYGCNLPVARALRLVIHSGLSTLPVAARVRIAAIRSDSEKGPTT